MPGWPSVGRADDQRLVEALCRAESRAADGLYDAYADRLNDYACSVLGDTDAAADSVHDALVTATGRAGELREPSRLRAWLYALTRFQCASRQGRTPAAGMAAEPFLEGNEDDPELAAIVREALAELGQKDREVLLLALRHELTPAEIGTVLGLTSRQTGSRLARARDHLENAAAAVILARTGRAHCPDLSALLDSIEGPLPQALRRRLTRHIIGCKECTEGRHRRVSAERLLDIVPVAFPPLSLRRRIAETCAQPERGPDRTAIMAASGVFDKEGFPPVAAAERRGGHGRTPERGVVAERRAGQERAEITLAYPSPDGRGGRRAGTGKRAAKAARKASRRSAPVFAAVACVLVATGAMVVASGRDGSPPGGATQTLRFPSHTPGELQISYAPQPSDAPAETETPAPSATPPPSATPARTAGASPSPGGARPRQSLPTATRTPSRPAQAPAGKLVVSCPGPLGGEGSGVILVSARNATVAWSANATAGVTVTPASGVLKPGVKARLTVIVSAPEEPGKATVTLRSATGGPSCAISWDGQDDPPAGSDPPRDPDPTPGPSDSATSTPQASEQSSVDAT
ncbi:RNA polymerase sigma factor [Sphaerisporangium fuscum]|uniref:RNA polymerase sigma factor n=1 Tax=Sphaerisporangium fuscum TaxID=2835868 RepID=UPI001BDD7AA3|nr:RNA polymerase sigma factor [Sphaerisporangium fuscum]